MDGMDLFNEEARNRYLPHISLDFVVFGFYEGNMSVLLLKSKRRQSWMLPGGFIEKNEDLKVATHRALQERTGAKDVYLQLFEIFGTVDRTKGWYDSVPEGAWSKQRFLTIGYYGLVNSTMIDPVADFLSDDCEWHPIDNVPALALDHQNIYDSALTALRQHINYKPIGSNLLPKQFTLPELQRLYESILGQKLHRGNFARKILSCNILVRLPEPRRGVAHKSPHLYEFDEKNYNESLQNGLRKLW